MAKLKNDNKSEHEDPISNDSISTNDVLLPYSSPQILSAEKLEAAAFVCEQPSAGKSSADGCGTIGKPLGS